MKKRLMALACVLVLLSGCASRIPSPPEGGLRILCTTYPVYLFTTAVVQGSEDIQVSLLVNQPTSCLHDYTLTVRDMKAVEDADVIIINGAGLEDFMDAALAQSDAQVIDCSQNIDLLPPLEHEAHEGHHHGEEFDPHFWMDPDRAAEMVDSIAAGLETLDGAQAKLYRANAVQAVQALEDLYAQLTGVIFDKAVTDVSPVSPSTFFYSRLYPLITFHDGFQYFADAFGFPLLKSIEEEDGATASAREVKEVTALIQDHAISAIFVEKNGSRTSAEVIARETGCEIYELDMLMSGNGSGIQPYLDAIEANVNAILNVLRQEEATP